MRPESPRATRVSRPSPRWPRHADRRARCDAGVPAAWVTGDEVYGADPRLRAADPRPRAGLRAGRSRPTGASPPRPARSASTRWPPGCPRGPGSDSRPAPGRRASASTPGPGSTADRPHDTDTARHPALVTADPPPPRHRRAGLPTLLQPRSRCRCATLVRRRRAALAHRGILPGRQRPRRARPAPGPPLDLLAPLDHAGDARPRPAGRDRRRPNATTDPNPTG